MVSGPRLDGGHQAWPPAVRRTIQSIKEIVSNHSDADIYVVLKENNMDPNETTQKLLQQAPFHEVRRKRDRKKENTGNKSVVSVEPSKNTELARIPLTLPLPPPPQPQPLPLPVKHKTYSDRNTRRGGYSRNSVSGGTREFRVVRDNRVNQKAGTDSKTVQSSIPKTEGVISTGSGKSHTTGASEILKSPADSLPRKTKDAALTGGNGRKELLGEKGLPIPSAASRLQTKANDTHLHSTNSSSSSVVGVYSSSSDPVHVPSPHSRPAANVGAIKREVGVVGPRRQSSENSVKTSSSQSTSLPNIQSARESHSRESKRPPSSIPKNAQPSQNMAPESAVPGLSAGTSSSNQYGNRTHQPTGHQKAPQPNKEWKPKSSFKPSTIGPTVTGKPAVTVSPPENPVDVKKEVAQRQDNVSRLKISENQNVIIAAHIRVSETDRCRLTFGSLGTGLDSSTNSVFTATDSANNLSTEPSGSVSALAPDSSGAELATGKQVEKTDGGVHSSGSNSPASGRVSDHQLTEKKESSSPRNLNNYTHGGLVRESSPSYTPKSLQQQETSELPSFSGYDPQMAYDISYFPPMVDDTGRGPGLTSSQDVMSSHTTNAIPASTIAMVQQQQQQQLAQMYPQLHVSPYANLMPYRQYISYVPPMHVPGYSNNTAYPHPSNGNSYMLMPGNSSHITQGGLKYGIQQFKPAPTGSPTGFGNFTSPTGYAVNTPGVGSTVGHEDSSRLKYKDNLYVTNPQAETSEIWMNPRDISSMQSAPYYNMPGQTPHGYLPSHGGHASFNAAAQSSHMQFPGMYHASPQPAAIASPHHLGPAIGGNVGVGIAGAAPGAQMGGYQQPQLGHVNWAGNF